jgi:hypothetical protein
VQGWWWRVKEWSKPRLPPCPPSRKNPVARGKTAGGRRKGVHAIRVHDIFFVVVKKEAFDLAVEIGGGGGVGAIGTLTALATGKWMMMINQRMSVRTVAQ